MRVSLVLDLLDHQIVDVDGIPVGRVDDLDLDLPPDQPDRRPGAAGVPRVTGLVMGAEALGHRIGGTSGRIMAATAARLRATGTGAPVLAVALVDQVRPLLRLTVREPDLPGVAGLEKWLRDHVIARRKGGR